MKEERAFFLVEKWKYSSNDEECLQIQNLTRSQICHQSSLCATNYWTMRRKSWRSGFCFIRSNVLTLITQQLRHRTERGLFLSRWEYKATLVRVIRLINWMFGGWCMVMCVSTNCLIMSDWLPSYYIPIELPISNMRNGVSENLGQMECLGNELRWSN